MQTMKWCAVALALVLVATAGGKQKEPQNKLPEAVVKALDEAKEIEVYSLNGDLGAKDGWHGATVLGKTTVKKEADRKALVSALKKGVEEGGVAARCFIPRHGIRVTHDGKTYDLLVCFQCHYVYIYADNSDKPQTMTISDLPQKTFNKILTDAKVKLATPDAPEKPK